MKKRKIKFALELKDGEEARSMEELRAYFDLEKIIGYYQDGRLHAWLEDRFCNAELEEIRKLTGSEVNLGEQLCRIFHVEQTTNLKEYTDVDDIVRRKERLDFLKQYTDDPAILEHADFIARNQKELEELLQSGQPTDRIYLCNNIFRFSLDMLNRKNIHYVGIGKNVVISIASLEPVFFESLGISFDNIHFDESYEKLKEKLQSKMPEKWFKYAQYLEYNEEKEEAMKWYLKAADAGYPEAMYHVGLYCEDEKDHGTPSKGSCVEWYEKAGNAGSHLAMIRLAEMYRDGRKVQRNFDKGVSWYTKAAKGNDLSAMFALGMMYVNRAEAEITKLKSDNTSIFDSKKEIIHCYDIAIHWFQHAAETGMRASNLDSDSVALTSNSMIELGKIYESGILENEDWKNAIKWYLSALNLGNEDASKAIHRLALSEFIYKLNQKLALIQGKDGILYPKRYVSISLTNKGWDAILDFCYRKDEIFHIHEDRLTSGKWLQFKEGSMRLRWKNDRTDWFPYSNINTVRYNSCSELIIEAQIQGYKKIICNMKGWSARTIAIFLTIAAKLINSLNSYDVSVVQNIQLDSLQGKSILSLMDTEKTTSTEKDEPFWSDDIIDEYSDR